MSFLLRSPGCPALPPADLGLSSDLLAEASSPNARECRGPNGVQLSGPMEAVMSGQSDWRAVRRYLNHHRSALARQAFGLYPAGLRLGRTVAVFDAVVFDQLFGGPGSRQRGGERCKRRWGLRV